MRNTAPNHLPARHAAVRLFVAALLAGVALTPPLPALAASSAGASAEANQTRVLPWTGGDQLSVALHAEVDYVPGADNKVVITGPADLIGDIVVDHGVIRHEDRASWHWFGSWGSWDRDGGPIRIVVRAPHLSAAHISGSGHLNLGRLTQDRLDLSVSGSGGASASGAIRSLSLAVSGSGGAKLDALTTADLDASLSGSGWITGSGTADSLRLHISGSGRADMAGLALQDAVAGLSGSGSASMAPKRSADLGVSGSGNIRLVTNPTHLSAHHSGSGRIIRPDGSNA